MKLSRIKETCLYISDIDKAKEFYHQKLGLQVYAFVEKRHIFFRVGENMLLCFVPEATRNEKILPPHFAYGPQHMAFEVPEKDYQQWKDKLKHLEIDAIYEQKWAEGIFSLYFNDPDGNVLEIVPAGLWD